MKQYHVTIIKWIAFILLVTQPQLSICQTGSKKSSEYPKVIVLSNGDTVVAVTRKQVRKANKLHRQYIGLSEEVILLKQQIAVQDSTIQKQKSKVKLLEDNSTSYETYIKAREEQIKLLQEERDIYKDQAKKYRKQRNVTGIGGILLIVVLIII